MLPGLAEGMSATAVACRNTDLLLSADWLVARLMALCPFSDSLLFTELVTDPGIFFRLITCLAELVVALLPVLLILFPAPGPML